MLTCLDFTVIQLFPDSGLQFLIFLFLGTQINLLPLCHSISNQFISSITQIGTFVYEKKKT